MKKLIFALLLVTAFISCKKDDSSNSNDGSKFTIMTDPNDPLIATATKDGGSIDFFGDRDGQGIPTNVNLIIVKRLTDTVTFFLNAEGKPAKIWTSKGVKFTLDWLTYKHAAVTIISDQGNFQLNTEVEMARKFQSTSSERLQTSSRVAKIQTLRYTPNDHDVSNGTSGPLGTSGTSQVTVTNCGFLTPVDNVFLEVKSTSGVKLGVFPAREQSVGKYTATFPNNIAASINLKAVCEQVALVLGYACDGQAPIFIAALCPAIAAGIAASGVGSPIAAPIFLACEEVASAMAFYCATVGASATNEAPSLASKVCQGEELNRDFREDLIMYAYVKGIPKNVYSPSITVSQNSNYPNFAIDLGSKTVVRNLTVTPVAPNANEDFTANAEVGCLKLGSIVTMSVVGTDGYSNSESVTITAQSSNSGIFSLDVPGANPGVRDDVTIKITMPDGSVVIRTASLVFK